MTFVDQPAVVVDLETTGANPALDRITEVGVLQVEGGEVVREWSSLVNPETPIPPFIAGMTGITDAMVATAPTFRELRHELSDLLRGRIFVAHNARFDYGFLTQEFGRVDMDFQERVLCSVKLSRRLWPEHRSHGLDAIIARHGIVCADRHRALGDARALWEYLRYIQEHVPAVRVAQAVAEVMRQGPSVGTNAPVDIESIPIAPGVYRFYDEDGALLYVGKCGNLRARVMAYFSGGRRSARETMLARQVRRVDWIETAGELGAWLVHGRLLAEDSPRLNRGRAQTSGTWSLRLTNAPGSDTRLVEVVDRLAFDASSPERHYGLFRSRRAALQALQGLAVRQRLCPVRIGAGDGRTRCEGYENVGCAQCNSSGSSAAQRLRLIQALLPLRLEPWPFRGRIGIREHDAVSGRTEIHVVDRWCYLGTARSEADLDHLIEAGGSAQFDADRYRLFTRALLVPGAQSRIVHI